MNKNRNSILLCNQELISIIIPTYNKANLISKSIQSVINQTYSNIEILVIDDGSIDDTMNIVNTFIDNRIMYSYKENGGLSDARNYGIKKCKGKYVMFLDADDYLVKEAIEILYLYLKETNSDLAQMKYKLIHSSVSDELNLDFTGQIKYTVVEENIEKKYLLSSNPSACTKLYNKRLFDCVEFPYKKKYEDYYTNYKIFKKIKRYVDLDFYGYNYVVDGESITRSKLTTKDFDLCELIRELIVEEDDMGLCSILEEQFLLSEMDLYIKSLKYGIEIDTRNLINSRLLQSVKDIKKNYKKVIKSKIIPLKKKLFLIVFFLPNFILINKVNK